MTLEPIATAALAVLGAIGLIVACISWFFRRGGEERELTVAVRDLTEAARELSGEFRSFRDFTVETLHSHDIRITRLEVAPPPIHVTTKVEAPKDGSAPAYRDPGPPS
jgi:hypothetical protein